MTERDSERELCAYRNDRTTDVDQLLELRAAVDYHHHGFGQRLSELNELRAKYRHTWAIWHTRGLANADYGFHASKDAHDPDRWIKLHADTADALERLIRETGTRPA